MDRTSLSIFARCVPGWLIRLKQFLYRRLAVAVNERCAIEGLRGVFRDVFGDRPCGLAEYIPDLVVRLEGCDS